MAFTSNNDVNILSSADAAIVGAGAGNDTYIVSPGNLPASTQTITISDTLGTNKLQLIGGLTIASSKVAADALQLVLSNGATINVNGASTFTFEIGGDPLLGTPGTIKTFAQFVTESLGVAAVPTGSTVADGAANVGVNANGSTTIPGAATYALTAAAASADEGTSATFNLVTTGVADGTQVAYTISGVDAADVDGGVLTGNATVTAGVATITVPVKADTLTEGAETLTVTLDGKQVSAHVAVNDISLSAPTFSVAAGALVVAEGQSATFTVTASSAVTADTVFAYSTAGIAATADDFTGLTSGTVTILAGQTSATFSVAVKADNVAELAESFTVTVKDSAGVAVATKTVDIQDVTVDKSAPVITAQAGVATYAENGAADVTLATVTATDDVGVVGYTIASGNADGFFQINAQGQISLTAAGADMTKAANDFETTPNDFVLGVTATDAAGNTSTAANYTLRVTDVDDRAPVLTGGIVNGTKAVLSYDETLGTTTGPAISDFAVGIKGTTGSVSVTGVKVVGTTVELTLGRAPTPGEVFNVTYTPGANAVEDVAGNNVAAITARDLIVDSTAPVITAGQTISYAEEIVTGVTGSRTTSTVLGKVAATDDTGVVSYNITGGNTSGFFAIDGSGNITMTAAGLAGSANDFEVTPNSTVLTVTATDGAGNVSAAQQVTLAETNVTSDDAAAPPAAAVIQMTTGNDNVTPTGTIGTSKTTESSDTVSAYFAGTAQGGTSASTIGLGDSFDAAGGTADKLILTLSGGVAFDNSFSPVLTNLEILELRSTGGSANIASLTGIAPALTTLNFDTSNIGATVNNVAAQVKTFGVTNMPAAGTSTMLVNTLAGTLTGTTDAATLNVSGNAGGTAADTTFTIASLAATEGYEVLNISSTGTASRLEAITVTSNGGTANNLNTINVTGTADLRVDTALAFQATGVDTLNAQDFSGALNVGLNLVAANNMVVTGGSGADRFNFGATLLLGANTTINGGVGNDTIGVDVSASALGVALTKINAASSIEVLELTGAAYGTALAANTLTNIHSLVLSGAAAAGTITNLENADNVTFTATTVGANTFNAQAPGAAATLNLAVSNTNGSALTAAITAGDFGTVNLTVTAANGVFGGAAQTITGAAGATLNVLGAANMVTTDGTTALIFTDAAGGGTINSSTATGNLNLQAGITANTITAGVGNDRLDGAAGNDSINGGGGNDIIIGGVGADQLTGGTGNDTFLFAAAAIETRSAAFLLADTTTANIDRVTDFNGNGALAGDVIRFAATTAGVGASATTSVTAVTVASANNFNDLLGGLGSIAASSATVAQVADVTVSAGSLAGRYLVLNDATVGFLIADAASTVAGDQIIALTGVTGTLNASDFLFV